MSRAADREVEGFAQTQLLTFVGKSSLHFSHEETE